MKLAIRLTVLALAAALPAWAEIDVTKYDMRPLIQLHATGNTITGQPFETDVFVYRGGPVFLAHTPAAGDSGRVARGVASPEQLKALNQALGAARVGQQRGNCGDAAPDYVTQYALIWHGQKRMKTIPVGGIYTDCPTDVIRIFDATCEFIWAVLGPAPEICVPANP
jgi:hypothetical protein